MIELKLQQAEKRYQELSDRLIYPSTFSNSSELQKITKEHADLELLVQKIREYRKFVKEREQTLTLIIEADPEIKGLARTELSTLEEKIKEIEQDLKLLLIPKDPKGEKNAIVEIRAGTGGEEAALFVADIFRMYSKYIEKLGVKVELIDSSSTEIGGLKEIVFLIQGKGSYGKFRFESGTHRVQRVPRTEGSGRIHTSAVTVAVLPEMDEVEVEIKNSDLRIDTFCSSGAGGQSVNTTYSAVRVTHLPTGIVAQCQDERSQLKNRSKAMKVLYSRVKEKTDEEERKKISANRKNQIGSGDRSEKIRTYNYSQNRVTDHRIGLSLHQLDKIMEGGLDELFQALALTWQEEQLKEKN